MSRRRSGRPAYLLAFLFVQGFTDLFAQYPTLRALAILGVVVVFVDAVVCARRRWRSLDLALRGETSPEN